MGGVGVQFVGLGLYIEGFGNGYIMSIRTTTK